MLDVAAISASVHGAFVVDVTVVRGIEDARTERAVLHLGTREWHTHTANRELVGLDAIDFLAGVDIEPDDEITCSDLTAVPAESTWTVRDQLPNDGDRHIQSWRITEVRSSEAI